jgi:hypothetical protein
VKKKKKKRGLTEQRLNTFLALIKGPEHRIRRAAILTTPSKRILMFRSQTIVYLYFISRERVSQAGLSTQN